MKYFTLVKKNIKRQWGNFIGILVLIFIITVSLCAVLAIWNNANAYEKEQIERIGYGDITVWVGEGTDLEALEHRISELEEVGEVRRQESLFCRFNVKNKEEENSRVSLIPYEPENYEYYIYNTSLTGKLDAPEALKDGEAYVPIAFRSLYGVKIGDKIEVEITGKYDTESFVIKGYFEDPVCGSTLMGFKMMLVSDRAMEQVRERLKIAGEAAVSARETMFHITIKETAKLTQKEFQKYLNDTGSLRGYTIESNYTKNTMMGFMLILQNFFSAFLLIFVAVLLIVTILVISHNINASIEQEYADIGILKALGYTKTDLRRVKLMQYLSAVLLGMAIGIPSSIPTVKFINRMIVPATGIMIPSDLPVGLCTLGLGMILLLLVAGITGVTENIGKITPIRAIRGGAQDIYFKSWGTIPICGKGLSFYLALRQVTSGKKQYISACLITVLLVFFLSLTERIGNGFGKDGEKFLDAFGAAPYDIGIGALDDNTKKEVQEQIASYSKISAKYKISMNQATIDGVDCLMYIIEKPEYLNILEGRTCIYDNEAVITKNISEELGIAIGDLIKISFAKETKEFIVTGFYQCANDMGENFAISIAGFDALGQGINIDYTDQYILEDASVVEELAKHLEEIYGEEVFVDTNEWSGVEVIVLALKAVGIFMYVICLVFILVVINMTGSRILYQEQHDLGIYRALGFSAGKLQMAFALRFALLALVGSVVGVVTSWVLADRCIVSVLKFCGISSFSSEMTFQTAILPGVVVTAFFFLFAYGAARKIKRIDPGILITE